MARSDAYITVECDKCSDCIEINLTSTAHGWDERDIDGELEDLGWTYYDGVGDICPACKE